MPREPQCRMRSFADTKSTSTKTKTDSSRLVARSRALGLVSRGYSAANVIRNPVLCYITWVGLSWADSADKHGIAHEDALHAILNAFYVEPDFDESRVPGKIRPTLFIGPPRDPDADLLEVMVEVHPATRSMHIFHVMRAQQKHLHRMG